MVRATAGFEGNHGGWKFAEEGDQVLAPQLLAQDRLLGGIHPMQLEDVFFAVGTPVTRRPPLRSRRAQLRHRAPTLGV
jgi:hypothetical protein